MGNDDKPQGSRNNSEGESDLESILTSSVLALEKIDINIYRGSNLWRPAITRFVFGGQIVGQALVAAGRTVPSDKHVHSLHAYFLVGGSTKLPVIYYVDRTRDGNTYTSRSVKAIQNGQAIMTMQVSFKCPELDSLSHQYTMPCVPAPEVLENTETLLMAEAKQPETSSSDRSFINKMLAEEIPIEIRPTAPDVFMRKRKHPPRQLMWVRARGHIGSDLNMHRCVAAYLSDITLLSTTLLPEPLFVPKFMTSLDHAMWFHTAFHVDEWMLYEMESPHCGSGKAISLGRLWRRDGTLAVSVVQEGIIRGKL